ncbi:MAG: futalosine hydrolase [Paenibacillaceae bacterium]|nr:futalosine hydrolase [Paenibacillaceae bacterium]
MGHDPLIQKEVLVITAVAAEKEAVLRGAGADGRIEVRAAGVGPAAAAACAAAAMASYPYRLVVSAGIGGGFAGKAHVGSLVIADEMIAADLGVETQEGFRSVEQMGFGSSSYRPPSRLVEQFARLCRQEGLSVVTGPVLTVSTATGSADTASGLLSRVPDAAAEAMEGYGVAAAARMFGVECLEIRGISNLVGPRDRSAWRIADALAQLERAFPIMMEVQ